MFFLISSCHEKCYHECSVSFENCQENCIKKYNEQETLIRCNNVCVDWYSFCCSDCHSE